ncbi:MAG: DNA replication/repair protein RecF [Pseudomonadales bacterium]
MLIRRLEITGVRNVKRESLTSLSQINILYGSNGAGKTSVLESIHLLSSARSFRTHKLKPLIGSKVDSCTVFAEIDIPGLGYQPVGVERFKSAARSGVIKVSGQSVKSSALLANNLPLQVICSDTFKLLEGAPVVRRQFLDWGVFHVEHSFHRVWKTARRCLKQRNTLLRHGRIDAVQLDVWTSELARLGQQLDNFRQQYIAQLVPVFEHTLAKLIDLDGLRLNYNRGWDKDRTLEEVFQSNRIREQELGYTLSGPHRADLRLRYQSADAADILSRGQQKLVVCALRVAQGYLLSQLTGRLCVFLVDDLPSELDNDRRKALCKLLEELQCQVFITCVDRADMENCWSMDTPIKMFHVEQGKITAVNS